MNQRPIKIDITSQNDFYTRAIKALEYKNNASERVRKYTHEILDLMAHHARVLPFELKRTTVHRHIKYIYEVGCVVCEVLD